MTVNVYCLKCGTLHVQGKHCPTCSKRYDKQKRDRKSQKFYLSKEWQALRKKVLQHYCSVDLFILGQTGKLQPCRYPVVHHIIELKENPALGLDFNNLVCVGSASHNTIHDLYDAHRKDEAIAILKKGIELFEQLQRGEFNGN